MARLLPIIQYPDPVLKTSADVVTFDHPSKLKELVEDLMYTMLVSGGVGLAANQVGVLQRVIAVDTRNYPGGLMTAMINPVINDKSGSVEALEGCLSYQNGRKQCRVKRAKSVTITYMDHNMQLQKEVKFTGITARCIQHEIDHLDGINMAEKEIK